MKKIIFASAILLATNIPGKIFSQCPSGVLSLSELPAGSKVVITEVSESDSYYKKRKDYIGETVTLINNATLVEDCWYTANVNFNGQQVWFDYFRVAAVEGENYNPVAVSIETKEEVVIDPPLTFDLSSMQTFITELYFAYVDSFKSIVGEHVGILDGGYLTTLPFPGASRSRVGGFSGYYYYKAGIGPYTDELTGYTAMKNLIETLVNVKVYPSEYSDVSAFLACTAMDPFEEGKKLYVSVGFLMVGTDALNRTFADKSLEMDLILNYTFDNTYMIEFEFYDKTKERY